MSKRTKTIGISLLLIAIFFVALSAYFSNIFVSLGLFALLFLGGIIYMRRKPKDGGAPTVVIILSELVFLIMFVLVSIGF